MEPAFCNQTRELIIKTAEELGISVHSSGTVVAIEGPRFSSKAESLMFRKLGGDIINMTSVPEVCQRPIKMFYFLFLVFQVVLAKEAGLCYASIALVTDYDCWKDHVVCVEDVMASFRNNVDKIVSLIKAVVPKIVQEDWDQTIAELKVKRLI